MTPSQELFQMPLSFLLPDLLKQFNKPSLLGAQGITLTKIEMDSLAAAIATGENLPDVSRLCAALGEIVQESLAELHARFNFCYEESLKSQDMSAIGGWETTAEFLEIANIKSNAELRISAGASLLAFLGDSRAVQPLFTLIEEDKGVNDVDAVIAKRALGILTGIAPESKNFIAQVKSKLGI